MTENLSVEVIEYLQNMTTPGELKATRGTALEAPIAAVPMGVELKSLKPFLDEYLTAPDRKKETSTHKNLESFIAHVNRHKDTHSVIFTDDDRKAPRVLAVYDYHYPEEAGGVARFGEFRAAHAFPLSDEWQSWLARDKRPMDQVGFAEFLEERILDVANPSDASPRTKEILEKMGDVQLATPTRLLALSKGLSVHVASKCASHVKIASGETQMVFETEHKDDEGQALVVPGAFLILVPLFQGGPLYPIIVRLRYRVERGGVAWHYALYRTEEMFELAIKTAIERVGKETGLPVFCGKP